MSIMPKICTFIFILFTGTSFGQNGIDYSLYISVAVFDKEPLTSSEENQDEIFSLDSSYSLTHYPEQGLSAFISDSVTLSRISRKRLLVAYLVNNSTDTITVNRIDEAIYKCETQVLVNQKWETFQLTLPSDCGNSYYDSKLPPRTYYVLQIPDPTDGNIDTKFRVKFISKKIELFTNAITIKLTKERIAKTKQEIKPVPWVSEPNGY